MNFNIFYFQMKNSIPSLQVSRNKIIGLSKILRELLEFKSGSDDEGGKLFQSLEDMATSSSYTMPERILVENIRKYREAKKEVMDQIRDYPVNSILRKKFIGENQPKM